jgi:F0F1-type ATP synthase assembly protein I
VEQPLLPEPPDRSPVSTRLRAPARRLQAGNPKEPDALPPRSSGWTVLSYLLAGMLAYGGLGWLVSRAVHSPVIFPVGMLLGLGISIGLVIHRYGRSSTAKNEHGGSVARGSDR